VYQYFQKKQQIHREDYKDSTPDDYYRKALFIPFLDHTYDAF